MLLGRFAQGHPRVDLILAGHSVQFLVDTGFEGELAVPRAVASQLCGAATGTRLRRLADGRRTVLAAYQVDLAWENGERLAEVLALEGEPIVGTQLLEGYPLHAEIIEGGEVMA